MACLGEESRFRLVQALMGGPRCVTDLAAEIGLSQSCTTRHLQALGRRRVVLGARDGKRVLYRIRDDDPRLMPLLGWALASQAAAAGGPPGTPRRGERREGPSPRPARGPIARPAAPLPGAGSAHDPAPAEATEAAAPGLPTGPASPGTPAADLSPPANEPPPRPKRPVRDSDIEDFLL